MNVFFDGQVFSFQKFGGISRYFVELYKNLNSCNVDIGLLVSNNQYLRELHIPYFDTSRLINFKGKVKLIKEINNLYGLYLLKNRKIDVFHPTYFDTYYVSEKKLKFPFVLTIHDMIHERYPNFFSKNDKTSEKKKILALRANAIIAVSQQTKNDIVDFWGIPDRKISVIHHGYNGLDHYISKINFFDFTFEYILFVGEREGYKNFRLFVEAFSLLYQKRKDIYLICIGKDFTDEEKIFLKHYNVDSNVKQMNATDEKLANLYKEALVFVYPSIAEGFGIPLLEAMGCGCPILASDSTCFQEIALDCAIYFDPYCKYDMFDKMDWALNNKEKLIQMVKKGKERVLHFTWRKSADETFNIYSFV